MIHVRQTVNICKDEHRIMPLNIFSFVSYSIADENEYKTIFILFLTNYSRRIFHLKSISVRLQCTKKKMLLWLHRMILKLYCLIKTSISAVITVPIVTGWVNCNNAPGAAKGDAKIDSHNSFKHTMKRRQVSNEMSFRLIQYLFFH